jgi:chemotaxis protein CheX
VGNVLSAATATALQNIAEGSDQTGHAVGQTFGAKLQLPAILDLKAAAPLAAALLARRGTELFVDAGEVQRLGAQCLQVLLSALASWVEDEQTLVFGNFSQDFTLALKLFGADSYLLHHQREFAS